MSIVVNYLPAQKSHGLDVTSLGTVDPIDDISLHNDVHGGGGNIEDFTSESSDHSKTVKKEDFSGESERLTNSTSNSREQSIETIDASEGFVNDLPSPSQNESETFDFYLDATQPSAANFDVSPSIQD